MPYATLAELKDWTGATNVSDTILQACLDEAEVSLRTDVGIAPDDDDPIQSTLDALHVAHGETLRRAQRNLARRNSPEGISGLGDLGAFRVPVRDPDSAVSVLRLREILGFPSVGIS